MDPRPVPLAANKLDPREEHFRIPSHHDGFRSSCAICRRDGGAPARGVVLYVHGATFPSALSIAHRFDGRSWRDESGPRVPCLGAWISTGSAGSDPLPRDGRAAGGARAARPRRRRRPQLECGGALHLRRHGASRLSIVAHSWGTIVAGRFAGALPRAGRAPRALRPDRPARARGAAVPGWRRVRADQWDRFVEDVPAGEPPCCFAAAFREWGELYLDTDPGAGRAPRRGQDSERRRSRISRLARRPSPTIPARQGSGRDHPRRMGQPLHRRRCALAFRRAPSSPLRRDIKIGRGTHLMHLEERRYALYRETEAFLLGGDAATR